MAVRKCTIFAMFTKVLIVFFERQMSEKQLLMKENKLVPQLKRSSKKKLSKLDVVIVSFIIVDCFLLLGLKLGCYT